MKKKISNYISQKQQVILTILGAVVLFCIYFKNIHNICATWEMPDEGGYLFNASLVVNAPWKEVFSNCSAYYGYGYSVLLIPFFFLCHSGRTLIQASVMLNLCIIILIYFLQIYLMQKLYDNVRYEIWIAVSFATSFYPYLFCNTYKVLPEVFLYFQTLLIAVLLYKAIISNSLLYYILTIFATTYIFFIHARAIIVTGITLLLLTYLCVRKKMHTKYFLLCLGIFVLLFSALYIIKSNIVDILGTGKIALLKDENIGNLFTKEYLLSKLFGMLKNIKLFANLVIAKYFYVATSTLGITIWGSISCAKKSKICLKSNINIVEKNIIFLFFICIFLFTLLACCVNGSGMSLAHAFYGRYYEYVSLPLLLLGFGALFNNEIQRKEILFSQVIVFILGLLSIYIKNYFHTEWIGVDTSRLPSISYAIQSADNNLAKTVYILIADTMIFLLIELIILDTRFKNIICILLVSISFFYTNDTNAFTIININEKSKKDVEIAEYMVDNWGDREAYYIYEPDQLDIYYMRMQVFVKDHQIHVILPDEISRIQKDDYIITYNGSETGNAFEKDTKIKYKVKGSYIELFIK